MASNPPTKTIGHARAGGETALQSRSIKMDDAVAKLARQLLDGGFTRVSDREQRVINHVTQRCHISRDVNSAHEEKLTFGDRLADKVARFGGSWTFIVAFTGLLIT